MAIALVGTVVVGMILIVILWLLNPLQQGSSERLTGIFSLMAHSPLIFVSLCLLFLTLFLVSLFGTRIYALLRYLREAGREHRRVQRLYTPLEAMANIRPTAEQNHHEVTAPTIAVQREPVSILKLLEQHRSHQLILGVPGAGKTMALRVYQYRAVAQPLRLIVRREYIPILIPMKNYSLYLKRYSDLPEETWADYDIGLLSYLQESDLPGMHYIAPYLRQLARQGRLLLLCDGLNEVDSNYLSFVSQELADLMLHSDNRLLMTCREIDYREQPAFVRLVERGQAACATIYPLQPAQIHQFVERYILAQDGRWRHTAGQIIQIIDRSRLRYHCTNPMMLFTLMEIIDQIGVERGKQIDTRGRLLRESVVQLIARESRQGRWSSSALSEQGVIRFLSVVACAARWANDRNAIQLSVSATNGHWGEADLEAFGDELALWLNENPARGPYPDVEEPDALDDIAADRTQLLQFALAGDLIDISPNGVLSFRHELIAEYFVAEYFFAAERLTSEPVIREEMLENVGRWSEPIAIWAGLLDDPLVLAEQFGERGLESRSYLLQALSLALVCVGVLWTPPQAEIERPVVLPPAVEEALSIVVRNKEARESLARIFTRCAEEGGQEVYRSLLPLIMVEGVDEMLILLDKAVVPDLLFSYLEDMVDDVAYEAQVKRLTRLLGRFGSVVVERAVELSQPHAERSTRLRAAAINILGGTRHPRAVEPLIERLQDTDHFVMQRAANALYRLGPELTLKRLLQMLEQRNASAVSAYMHQASLVILERFMSEPGGQPRVTLMQYLRILETIVPVLTSNYQHEPQTQQRARDILVRLARNDDGVGSRDNRWEKVIEALLLYLPSQNEAAVKNVIEALREIGTVATPRLLSLLQQPAEIVRIRILDVLKETLDPLALPDLLRLVSEPGQALARRVADALYAYAPSSIPGLIELVLDSPREDAAERAASILKAIGERAGLPIIEALAPIVQGRTRILVQILADIHEVRAVSRMIEILQMPYDEPLLTITLIRALGLFSEPRVVPPLLSMLSSSHVQFQEEAIEALSQFGSVALPDLVAALEETTPQIRHRLQRAILGMHPFPGEELIKVLETGSDVQVQALLEIFQKQGDEAAHVLVQHLLHPDQHVRTRIYQTLEELPGAIVVPALLEALGQVAMRPTLSSLLLKHPEAAIAPLVSLLGDEDLGATIADLLPRFGIDMLAPLIMGLNDQRSAARNRAQACIISLVRQSDDQRKMLDEIVNLFYPPPPERSREVLLGALTSELAELSLPSLLAGLEDAHLLDGVAEALKLLAHKREHREYVLSTLVAELGNEERRRGAMLTLVQIGVPTVPYMGNLITAKDVAIARAAKEVLRDLGVLALPFILSAQSDHTAPDRREAALEVFNSMSPQVIREELVEMLSHDAPSDMAMAITLLLERIFGETIQGYEDHVMVMDLIEHVQTHSDEKTNQRIIALLLLLGEPLIVKPLLQALDADPRQRKLLTSLFLLLGKAAQEEMLHVFREPETTVELREELAAVLGMRSMPEAILEYAQDTHRYGISTTHNNVSEPEQLTIALRALGSLLAGGQWNVRRLQELRSRSREGLPEYELFSMLLGYRYTPRIQQLQNNLQEEQDKHKRQMETLVREMASEKQRSDKLQSQFEDLEEQHEENKDELSRVSRERQRLRGDLDKLTREKEELQAELRRMTGERDTLRREADKLSKRLKDTTSPNTPMSGDTRSVRGRS
ncbi:hypothetical protein KSX_36500 [Ktedonospora formicarum]|uniref:NACHT domain-containing protein n=1 Tax=Ktedonospora formicarum TaxID=2778364 RepID=A0A8J3I3E6_9CHLR|nr:hypothetical protein KSX_36500 [Ktedonospora formicarum]